MKTVVLKTFTVSYMASEESNLVYNNCL